MEPGPAGLNQGSNFTWEVAELGFKTGLAVNLCSPSPGPLSWLLCNKQLLPVFHTKHLYTIHSFNLRAALRGRKQAPVFPRRKLSLSRANNSSKMTLSATNSGGRTPSRSARATSACFALGSWIFSGHLLLCSGYKHTYTRVL